VRKVEPRRFAYANGTWRLTAHCQERQEVRTFRLDRIEHLEARFETFRARPSAASPEAPTIEVSVRFQSDISRWVRERQHWSFVAEEASNDALLAHYRPLDLNEIAPWLLGSGTAAEVIAPQELRDHLREEARSLSDMLT